MDNLLKEAFLKLNIDITDEQIDKFYKYKDNLLEYNKHTNLTTITNNKDIMIKHFIDSITPLLFRDFSGKNIIDVGTGAGFPSIPIKIMCENTSLTLLDSLNKRITFLKDTCDKLNLGNISFIHSRAEDSGKNPLYREKYDISISRAVCNLSSLIELSLPFIKIGGELIALKGPSVYNELKSSEKCIKMLGGDIYKTEDITLPFTDITHTIVFIKKIKNTPNMYPRRAGTVTKNPIL